MTTILLVEDDDACKLWRTTSKEDYTVVETGDGAEALNLAREQPPI